jgi:hypothetical protein
MENMKNPQGITEPKKVLDGHDLNQDVGQLIGYVHTVGIHTGTKGIFPSEHYVELVSEFLRKHRNVEFKSPKARANDAFQIQRLAESYKFLKKSHGEISDKLEVHEHYMKVIMAMGSQNSGRTIGDFESLADNVTRIANSLKAEAEEFMTKPESFDDIDDDGVQQSFHSAAEKQPN